MMASSTRILDAAQVLVASAERLRGFLFSSDHVDSLLNYSSIATFRNQLGPNRPVLVGFIGCTGTGKSTVFNSLAGKEVSLTGWRAHNTSGPVVLAHDSFFQALDIIEKRFGSLMFSNRKRETNSTQATKGNPNRVIFISTNDSVFYSLALIDLPDINTTISRDESMVALQLLPWLDVVIFLVDDETIYHRDYDPPSQLTKQLQQKRMCILNHRGRDRFDLNHPDIQNTKQFFGVDSIHVFPLLTDKSNFEHELSFVQFKNSLLNNLQPAPLAPLFLQTKNHSTVLVNENEKRKRLFDEVRKEVNQQIDEFLTNEPPISLDKVLQDEVIQVLNHLGLKRFALSNIYNFIKKVMTTGTIKRSFQVSFGDSRDRFLDQVFRPDVNKLSFEIRERLSKCMETIGTTVRRKQGIREMFDIAPELRHYPKNHSENQLDEDLREIVKEFESNCRSLLSSDKLAGSIKNDPLVTLFLAVALIADTFTVPGFGSWLLVPSAFKYVPLGKFESVKRKFQRQTQDLIRKQMSEMSLQLNGIRARYVLDESDPLLKALHTCAEYK